jgi:hypothetical protein
MVNLWSKLMTATQQAASAFIGAFREDSVTATLLNSDEFDEYSGRRLRYAMYAASYENTSYRNIHSWAQGKRNRYGLGKYIRDIYNPTAQLVNFHKATVWRGNIAPLLIGGAIPLIVSGASDDAQVRTASDNLLRMSNYEVGKNVTVQKGCNLGDVGLKLVDDPRRGQVRIEVIDPSQIEAIVLDNGIAKAYRLTAWRDNENDLPTKYSETCERGDGDDVIYRTYINDKLIAWPGAEAAEWVEPYGFIPFVAIQHNNVGGAWGWAEAHPIQGKIMEMDDQASMLSDYIRKSINAPALISGVAKPSAKLTTTTSDATADNPQPGREESKILWSEAQASYTPMIANLDIPSVISNIQNIMAGIESEMPELRKSMWDISGDPSGVALATAREPAEAKIINVRTGYDAGITRTMQMGIAIGGWRGYKGFDGFDLQSYENGLLDISIAPRPVFQEQRNAKQAEKMAFWTGWAQLAGTGTIAFETYARDFGWTDEQLKAYGTQKAADILAAQEDVIPMDGL